LKKASPLAPTLPIWHNEQLQGLKNDLIVSSALGRYCQLGAEEAELPRAQPSREYTSAHEGNTSRIAPGEEGAIKGNSVLTGPETMTAELEVVVD
jgi:hypothetical protein